MRAVPQSAAEIPDPRRNNRLDDGTGHARAPGGGGNIGPTRDGTDHSHLYRISGIFLSHVLNRRDNIAFTTMRDDGTILGPWSAWLHEPELGTAIWGVTKAMTRFRYLPEVSRQIVILVVGTHFGVAYEIYAHSAVARAAGISEDQIATITAGRWPLGLSEEAETAYDAAAALLNGGVLAASAYRRAVELFGPLGVKELIYLSDITVSSR
jgi:hypothetical protein